MSSSRGGGRKELLLNIIAAVIAFLAAAIILLAAVIGFLAAVIGFLVAVIGWKGAVMGTHILWALGTHMLLGSGNSFSLWALGRKGGPRGGAGDPRAHLIRSASLEGSCCRL